MSLKLNSSGGGSITLQEPSTASNRTLTLPDNTGNLISSADSGTVSQTMLASGVATTGPAFSAYRSTNQTGITTATFTKVTFDVEEFDTNNNFASSRFTPTVAGYYQINWCVDAGATNGSTITSRLYKNGAAVKNSSGISSTLTEFYTAGSSLVYLNGSTDYVEVYVYIAGASNITVYGDSGVVTYFQGFLARAA